MKQFNNKAVGSQLTTNNGQLIKLVIGVIFLFITVICFSQNIGINATGATPNASALLDINASPGNNKGLLIPRVALTITTSNAPIGAGVATSLLVYNTATINDVTPGYYFWDGTVWERFNTGTGGGNGWDLFGNAGLVDATNFLGTTAAAGDKPLNFRVNNQKAGRISDNGEVYLGYQAGNSDVIGNNVGIGYRALYTNTSGNSNIAIGFNALYTNNGDFNTAVGSQALLNNSTGQQNTAIGAYVLYANTIGYLNTAIGVSALQSNIGGNYNTGIGHLTLSANTNGNNNTASGYYALYANKVGSNATAFGYYAMAYANNTTTPFTNYNVAVGFEALRGSLVVPNNTGNWNTALGYQTLLGNSNGNYNTASGYNALSANTIGFQNTASGASALASNISGSYNAGFGVNVMGLNNGTYNTAVGVQALYNNASGNDNTAIGYAAGYGAAGVNFTQCTFVGSNNFVTVARSNVTMLGYGVLDAQCTGNNQVCVGNTSILAGGLRAAVIGWTAYSDARYKTNIKENVAGLDFILKLKPVTYNVRPKELYKIWGTPDSLVNKIDHSETEKETRIGFLAQDVEKAAKESGFNFPGIDIPRNDKEVYTLRYTDFIMPMVKGMQEQQKIIYSQQSTIDKLQTSNDKLQTEILNLKSLILNQQSTYDAWFKTLEEILGTKARGSNK